MLGARIAALRRSAGWNQAELARRLQVSASTVGMYEQGRREPSAEMLVALAEAFQVSTDYLLTGKARDTEAEAMEKMVLSRIETADRRLDEQRQNRPFSRQELVVLFAAMLMEE